LVMARSIASYRAISSSVAAFLSFDMTHPFRSWSTSLTAAAIRQRRYAGHGCAFSHANLADFGLLGFFGCLKELDQGANPS
jgi:hypothetical protein